MSGERILVADDERGIRSLLRSFCESEGYEVTTAADGSEALRALTADTFAVCIVDLNMPGASGIEVLSYTKEHHPDTEVVILTGYADLESAVEALRLGAYDYLQKPVAELQHLGHVITRALERRSLNQANTRLIHDLTQANREIERRRRQEIEYIQQIGQAMAGALDAREIAQVLVQAILNAIGCDVAGALLLRGENDEHRPWSLVGSRRQLSDAERACLTHSLVSQLPPELRPCLEALEQEVAILDAGDDLTTRPLSGVSAVAHPLEPSASAAPQGPHPCGSATNGRGPSVQDEEGCSAIWPHIERGLLSTREEVEGVIAFACDGSLAIDSEERGLLGILVSQGSVALANWRLFARTRELAVRDGVTGLYNHRHFYELLDTELARAQRYGYSTAVIMIDLDRGEQHGLKAINDKLGHVAGDELLRLVGRAIEQMVRRSDVVARYGGDEFVVLAPQTNAQEGEALAQRIARRLRESTFDIQGVPAQVTASIGVSVTEPRGSDTASNLVVRADTGLYCAKDRGGDQVCFVVA